MEHADVVVVGGGIAGLAAAWHLRGHDVRVLEASSRLGGRLRSEPRGEVWLNFGAHVFAGSGSATDRLLTALEVPTAGVTGRLAAVALGGTIAASGAVETYPLRLPLSAGSRFALIRAGAKLRLFSDSVAVDPRAIANAEGRPYTVFAGFSKKWRAAEKPDPHPAPAVLAAAPGRSVPVDRVRAWKDLAANPRAPRGGERIALAALDRFLERISAAA